MAFAPRMDRMVGPLTGSYAAGPDETSWTLGFTDNTLNQIVGSDFSIITMKANSAGAVTATGDFSGITTVIGRSYLRFFEATRPFVRLRDGRARVGDAMFYLRANIAYVRTGRFTVRAVSDEGFGTISDTFQDGSIVDGVKTFMPMGRVNKTTIRMENSQPFPFTITSIEYQMEHQPLNTTDHA